MSLSITVTPKELERQAELCFVGKAYKVFLATDPEGAKGINSTISEWEEVELSQINGYQPVVGTIGNGLYNSAAERFDLPTINAQFTGTGSGYEFDTMLIAIEDSTYLHSLIRFTEPVILQSGVSKSYLLKLVQDD